MNKLPPRRFTDSRANYWQGMFNDFADQDADHAISGWSVSGLARRYEAYCAVLPELAVPAGGSALDLGCGTGVYTRYLASQGLRAVGADYAWKAVAKGSGRCAEASFVAASAYQLPMAAGTFDHVVCIGLFQSLDDHVQALRETARVLKPGGSLCLMTLNSRQLAVWAKRVLGREDVIVIDGKRTPRLKTYEPNVLAGDARAAGLTVLGVRPVQVFPDSLLPARKVIGLWNSVNALGLLTARSFMILARKPS